MTPHEQSQIKADAWERYQTTKDALAAYTTKLEHWGRKFAQLGKDLSANPDSVLDARAADFPTREEFAKTLEGYRVAQEEFRVAKVAAARFKFPVD